MRFWLGLVTLGGLTAATWAGQMWYTGNRLQQALTARAAALNPTVTGFVYQRGLFAGRATMTYRGAPLTLTVRPTRFLWWGDVARGTFHYRQDAGQWLVTPADGVEVTGQWQGAPLRSRGTLATYPSVSETTWQVPTNGQCHAHTETVRVDMGTVLRVIPAVTCTTGALRWQLQGVQQKLFRAGGQETTIAHAESRFDDFSLHGQDLTIALQLASNSDTTIDVNAALTGKITRVDAGGMVQLLFAPVLAIVPKTFSLTAKITGWDKDARALWAGGEWSAAKWLAAAEQSALRHDVALDASVQLTRGAMGMTVALHGEEQLNAVNGKVLRHNLAAWPPFLRGSWLKIDFTAALGDSVALRLLGFNPEKLRAWGFRQDATGWHLAAKIDAAGMVQINNQGEQHDEASQ